MPLGRSLLSYKRATTLRASAVVPAAGAFDATATMFNVVGTSQVTLFVTQVQGANAACATEFIIECSNDGNANGVWFVASIDNVGALVAVAGVGQGTALDNHVERLPARNCTVPYTFTTGTDFAFIRVKFAEYGNVATPSTVTCTATRSMDG